MEDGSVCEFLTAVTNNNFDVADLILEHDEKTRDLVKKEEICFFGKELKEYYSSRNKMNNDTTAHYRDKLLQAINNDKYIVEYLRTIKTDEGFKSMIN